MNNYGRIVLLVGMLGIRVSQSNDMGELITAKKKKNWHAVQSLMHLEV